MAADEPEIAPGWLPPRPTDRPPSLFTKPAAPRAAAPARTVSSAPPAGPTQSPQAFGPAHGRPGAPPGPPGGGRFDPLATTALVLGIAGLLLLLLSLGIGFLFSLPFSVVGWRLGVVSKRRIAAGRYQQGAGVAQAGVVIGLIGIALGVVGMIVWSILILNGLSLEEFQRDLERELEQRREAAR